MTRVKTERSPKVVPRDSRSRPRFQFSLATLLLLPLLLSPLFFGSFVVSNESRYAWLTSAWAPFIGFVYGALYSLVFVLIGRWRDARKNGRHQFSLLWRSIVRGGWFGVLFVLLIMIPGIVYIVAVTSLSVWRQSRWLDEVSALGVIFLIYVLIGMFVGSVVGLLGYVKNRYARKRAASDK